MSVRSRNFVAWLRGMLVAALAATVLVFYAGNAWSDPAKVTVDSGVLVGTRDGNVMSFKGIPYAKPPVGPLRWKPTEKPDPWTGEREATEFGPECPQPGLPGGNAILAALRGGTSRQSEDCLTLNVFAPANHSGPLPVMVWIHGGAFMIGSASQRFYDGATFANEGVILVSIEYRLGLLGYFAHPALTAEAAPDAPLGNYGLMDQIAALQWVQRNIAVFGGDPKNVTVFGESAGGVSTLYLITNPSARGLFQKAVVESGGGWMPPVDLATKEKTSVRSLEDAGIDDGARMTAAELRAIPADKLVGQLKIASFGPFVDGRLVQETPTRVFAEGKAARVSLIIGSNSDEGSLMDTFKEPPAQVFKAFPDDAQGIMRKLYAPEAQDDETLAHRLYTDGVFGGPARWIAQMMSKEGNPVWQYYFSYVPERQRGKALGAHHGGEIPFVFDTLDKIPLASMFLSDQDKQIATEMHESWLTFAKDSRPAFSGGPAWPAVTPGSHVTMEFGVDTGIRTDLRKAELDFQEKYSKLFHSALE